MQRLFSFFTPSARRSIVQKPVTQPQELSAEQLKQVSGGLPKGGWGSEPPATTALDSSRLPKGGW